MAIDAIKAALAYAKGATTGATPGLGAKDPAEDFATMVRDAAGSAIDTLRNSEALSAKGLAGKADLNEVVAAVSNAEVTLQTVLAVRDKVIAAYQDILRMPI